MSQPVHGRSPSSAVDITLFAVPPARSSAAGQQLERGNPMASRRVVRYDPAIEPRPPRGRGGVHSSTITGHLRKRLANSLQMAAAPSVSFGSRRHGVAPPASGSTPSGGTLYAPRWETSRCPWVPPVRHIWWLEGLRSADPSNAAGQGLAFAACSPCVSCESPRVLLALAGSFSGCKVTSPQGVFSKACVWASLMP